MKLTFLLVFVGALHVSAHVHGQERVTLRLQQVEISKALNSIEKQSVYRFLYNSKLEDMRKKISIDVDNTAVSELLDRLFSSTHLTYKMLDNHLIVVVSNVLAQQDIKVTGKVTGANGEPLSGVSVAVKGSSRGTTTDLDGNYTLLVPENGTLVISYIGYSDQEKAINSQSVIDVKLVPSNKALDQVVVVGYGAQRKVDVTGASATVTGEAITKQPIVSIDQALQGKVAGLNVVNSGVPGSPSTIQLRGVNSISGSTAPIYVVDGNITTDISYLNPNEIEKVDVLKDASSLAIFGVNAGNGAIMITTKRGKNGKPKVTYNGYVGFQKTNHLIKMANASQYAEVTNEQYRALGEVAPYTDSSLGTGTNWYNQILRKGLIHSNDLVISGGSEHNTYNLGAGYIYTQGTVKETDYNNLRLHFADEYRIGRIFKVGENINVSRYIQDNPTLSQDVVKEAYNYDPTVVPITNGVFGVSKYTNSGNPAADLFYNNQDKLTGNRISGNIYGEAYFLKHFTFRSDYDLDYNESKEKKYTPTYYVSANQQNTTSTLYNFDYNLTTWYWRNFVTYDQRFGDHHVTAIAGTEARETNDNTTYLTAKSVPAPSSTQYFSLGDPSSFSIVDGAISNAIFSYYGRVNYAFKDRYLLNANIRSDYSSQYPSNHRNIVSPAIGAGWRISEEDFMQNLKPVLSNLKLRYSWGRLPNANLPNSYIAYPQIGTIAGQGGSQPVLGGSLNSGITAINVPNPLLSWEYTEESDPGVEVGFFNNKLTLEADYFNRKTHNLVIDVPIPSQSGVSNTEYENAGTVQNKGFEFAINYSDNSKDFKWNIGVTLATLQNKMLYVQQNDSIVGGSLGNGYLATITKQGLPVGTYYGYQVTGVFQNATQLSSLPHTSAAQVGDFIYKDINKDGVIDDNDRVNLGSNIPKLTYGINTSFSYRNFDLEVDFQGVWGNKLYNGNRSVRLAGYNFDEDQYTHRWHGEGTSNSYPAALNGSDSYAYPSSFFVESGSYFRIRNLQLGYNLPWVKKWGLAGFRIFANAQNLATFYKYHGFNPEVTGVSANPFANGLAQTSDGSITQSGNGQALNSGVDLSVYPMHTTYNFGLNVMF